jgi:DNA-binding winged helix-turn-helix (wHTH) protein
VDAQLVDPPFSTAQLALLSLLYRRAGEIVSRTEIVTTVWTDIDPEGVSSEAVDGLIKRLRGRLRPYNTSQEYIEVVRGHGLRLNQPQ